MSETMHTSILSFRARADVHQLGSGGQRQEFLGFGWSKSSVVGKPLGTGSFLGRFKYLGQPSHARLQFE